MRHPEHPRELRELDEAAERAGEVWRTLSLRHPAGEAFLRDRGMGDVVSAGAVRFGYAALGVPVYRDGRLVDVLALDIEDGRTVIGLAGAPAGGTLGDRDAAIARSGRAFVVVGVLEFLAALALYPNDSIIAARTTAELPAVVANLAARLRRSRSDLLLVPPHDSDGVRAHLAAVELAAAFGLPRERVIGVPMPEGLHGLLQQEVAAMRAQTGGQSP